MATKASGATITLIRGRNYSVIHPTNRRLGAVTFTRGEAIHVEDDAIVTLCEGLVETVIDGDDEEVQKPIFLVERGARARGAVPLEDKTSRGGIAARGRGRPVRKL
jgi:hypothetical protein